MAINSTQCLYCTLQYIKFFNVINYCDLIITAMLEAGSLKLSYRLKNFPSSRLVAGDSVIGKICRHPPSLAASSFPMPDFFFSIMLLSLIFIKTENTFYGQVITVDTQTYLDMETSDKFKPFPIDYQDFAGGEGSLWPAADSLKGWNK